MVTMLAQLPTLQKQACQPDFFLQLFPLLSRPEPRVHSPVAPTVPGKKRLQKTMTKAQLLDSFYHNEQVQALRHAV